jgi:hypothetical protein
VIGIADGPEVHALLDELTTTDGRENPYPRYELRRESLPSAHASARELAERPCLYAGSRQSCGPPTARWW